MSRLTGPVTSNLTDDMNVKQGHKGFFYEPKFCFLFFFLPPVNLGYFHFFQTEIEKNVS